MEALALPDWQFCVDQSIWCITEHQIENTVIRNVARLGYASALAVRNARIGENEGQVDLALFPRIGKKKLILVEAKRGAAEESKFQTCRAETSALAVPGSKVGKSKVGKSESRKCERQEESACG
ncbi:MAG: hypothetical protein AAGI48_18320 [Verrucomicrobiota bacterium]